MVGKLEELGLEAYLDSTKGLHNNRGFKEFVELYEANEPKNVIAVKFAVTRPTVYDWIERYDKMRLESTN